MNGTLFLVMDITGKPLRDCRNFSVPFILISAVFFSLYLFIAAGILANLIPGSKMLYLPDSGFVYFFNGTFFFAVLIIVSFAGSILLVRMMKKRSMYWQAGLPFSVLTGIITTAYVIMTFYEPSNPALRCLAYALIAGILGHAMLPACAVYFLNYWKKTCGSISDADIRLSSSVGILGLVFLVCVLFYAITYVPPPVFPYHDNFLNFTLADVLILLFGLFYGAILLPAVGLLFLARGLEYRKLPSEPDDEE